jgi:hypothetical protein
MSKLRLGVSGAGSWAVISHPPNFAGRRDEVEPVAVVSGTVAKVAPRG